MGERTTLEECLNAYSIEKEDQNKIAENKEMEILYRVSCRHFLDALIGITLKNAAIPLTGRWEERISKAVRRKILFDMERTKIFHFMEKSRIWYLPLKGIVVKDYYP